MAIERLRRRLMPWLEARLGASPEALATPDLPVVALDTRLELAPPVFAVALGGRGVVTTRPDWEAAVRGALDGLTYDLLFSIYGAYELSRATLPHGFTGWGTLFLHGGGCRELPYGGRRAPRLSQRGRAASGGRSPGLLALLR